MVWRPRRDRVATPCLKGPRLRLRPGVPGPRSIHADEGVSQPADGCGGERRRGHGPAPIRAPREAEVGLFAYLFTPEVVVVLALFTAYLEEDAVGMFNAQLVRAVTRLHLSQGPRFAVGETEAQRKPPRYAGRRQFSLLAATK